jgi:hypothetical protein
MNIIQEFKFKNIYELTDMIDSHVKAEVELWNYNTEYFINGATRFSKSTLLHLYIVTTAFNYYRTDFRNNGSDWDDESMQKWYSLFDTYQIKINKFNFNGKAEIIEWFDRNENQFFQLFDQMADEVFHVLFANRQFLLEFNILIAKTVIETKFPDTFLSGKGTIKRTAIPKWVKTAVFHRDKGRCVFCLTDLTSLINTLTSSNYDHIVPLDLFGTNDPCNVQLTCEKCNKSKANKNGSTSGIYIPWWPR